MRINFRTAFTAFTIGVKNAFSAWKMWLLLYVFNLLFAFTVVAPIAQYMEKKIGGSLLVEELAEGFNYTVMHDFLYNYEVSIFAFVELALVVGGLYLLLSVFAAGGMLSVFTNPDRKNYLQKFWSGGARFFWRMLRVTVYFLLIHAAVLAFFGGVFWLFSPAEVTSELQLINLAKIILPFYVVAALTVALWQDFTKLFVVRRDEKLLFKSFRAATGFVFKNYFPVLLFYLLNLALLGVFYLVYRFGSLTFTGMNAVFFFGQIFIIGRVGVKIWIAAGSVEAVDGFTVDG